MARLKLDNVFYETANPSKIEKLISLGAEELEDEVVELENLTVAELKAIAESLEVEDFGKMKKSELLEAIKAAEGEGDSDVEPSTKD